MFSGWLHLTSSLRGATLPSQERCFPRQIGPQKNNAPPPSPSLPPMGEEPGYLVKEGLVDEDEIAICISIAFLIFIFIFFHSFWAGVYVATCDLIKLHKGSVFLLR